RPCRTRHQRFPCTSAPSNVQDGVARVPWIGQFRTFGSSNYDMRFWVTPDTLANMGLTVTDLVNAISAQNVVNPAGTIGGEPAPGGRQFTYTVRARARLMSAEEVRFSSARANPGRSLVRLQYGARTARASAYEHE